MSTQSTNISKQDVVAILLEKVANHDFTPTELERFCNETAAEVNASNSDDLTSLVKSAKMGTKGITLGLRNIVIKKENVTLRSHAFAMMMQTLVMQDKFVSVKYRLDLSDLCRLMRDAWKRKDERKEKEAAAQAAATPKADDSRKQARIDEVERKYRLGAITPEEREAMLAEIEQTPAPANP